MSGTLYKRRGGPPQRHPQDGAAAAGNRQEQSPGGVRTALLHPASLAQARDDIPKPDMFKKAKAERGSAPARRMHCETQWDHEQHGPQHDRVTGGPVLGPRRARAEGKGAQTVAGIGRACQG
eukprot:CAMPEP_0174357110 /NCGR_PEP_ID=MMETSP0811_2-20130205/34087_1 /TAXON_ID=73025 ORGANISM="Eutreptiella gymnastica-like, Strain CCMP1594" /NCGR_SAMPLE_ID=MMETSP0811_2 /ASSEMBLY_ACC=CAM_ASM_000667 /LENGTH=121 /DNA_ID=CAMNT_0015489647 /DNA_START=196 /DNA_END=563 /DNA_ORIENTATION=+